MPIDDELHTLLGPADAPNRLDAQRIVARSRTRRRPKRAIAATMGALALAGVTVLAVQTTQGFPPSVTSIAEDMAGDRAAEADSPAAPSESFESVGRAPADKVNLCSGPLAQVAPSQSGLMLSLDFPQTASLDDGLITGTVTMTNTTDARVTGFTSSSPAITLSQDGTVLWHSNGPMTAEAEVIDLDPGETVEYSAFFVPVGCGVDDDLADTFRSDLSPVVPGTYDLTAAIDFTDDATQFVDLVTGPATSIELR